MSEMKFPCSINTKFLDKTPENKSAFVEGFQGCLLSMSEIRDVINQGWAISYCYDRDIRKNGNFVGTGFLAVDIDAGLRIEDAMSDPFVKSHCSLFYCTPSHTPDDHRFRLVFGLEQPIEDPTKLRAATTALIRRFGGDSQASDPSRIFFGCRDSNPKVFPNYLPIDVTEDLIEIGRCNPSNETISFLLCSGSSRNGCR